MDDHDKKAADAKKKADDEIKRKAGIANATKLVCVFIKEQRWLIATVLPFLFLAQMGDVVVPLYIGLVIDAMKKECSEDVYRLIGEWAIFLTAGAICAFVNKFLFGYMAEQVGKGIREKLFRATINKDITFFDSKKTGDIISRLSSDTVIVQEGMSQNIAMFI